MLRKQCFIAFAHEDVDRNFGTVPMNSFGQAARQNSVANECRLDDENLPKHVKRLIERKVNTHGD